VTVQGSGDPLKKQSGEHQLLQRPVRIALVGCGDWGPKVARAASSLATAEISAVVDLDQELAAQVQRQYPAARATASLADVLDDQIDAVIVATNPSTHVAIAMQALAAGKHVLVEKPLALSAADCRALGSAAEHAGLVLMVGHTFRFSPPVQYVREMLDRGELGEIYYIDSQRLNLGRVRQDVDAIWNFAPHDVSIINHWMKGPPRAVHCHAYDFLQPGVADMATMALEYESAAANIQISWLSPSKVRHMTVVGSEKMVVYDDVAGTVLVHDAGIDRKQVDRTFADFNTFGEFRLIHRLGDVHMPRLASSEPLVVQCQHFVDCITSGEAPMTGWEEAAAVVEVLEAATASHKADGARVELPTG
jgi:predicted dehydrogenase